VESAYNNHDANFFVKNNLSLTVTMIVAGKTIERQIFNDRLVEAVNGRLAVNKTDLITYVPCNGYPLGIGVKLFRSDNMDPIPEILRTVNSKQQDPILTQYASKALPYVQLGGLVGQMIYDNLKPLHGDVLIETTPASLPATAQADMKAGTLQDCFVLQYVGPDQIWDASVYVDDGEVRWVQNNEPLRSGPWVLFRVRKYVERLDQDTTDWDPLFQQSLFCFSGAPGTDPNQAEKLFTSAETMLNLDKDFTPGDRRAILKKYTDAYIAAKKIHPQDAAAVAAAVRAASVNEPGVQLADLRIDPERMAQSLTDA
jgi:hypothetical protein